MIPTCTPSLCWVVFPGRGWKRQQPQGTQITVTPYGRTPYSCFPSQIDIWSLRCFGVKADIQYLDFFVCILPLFVCFFSPCCQISSIISRATARLGNFPPSCRLPFSAFLLHFERTPVAGPHCKHPPQALFFSLKYIAAGNHLSLCPLQLSPDSALA